MVPAASMRDRILETVQGFPGIHLRSIVRHLGTSIALAQYHVKALEDQGLIRSVHVGGFLRYFPAKAFKELAAKERTVLVLLRRERALEIALALLEFGRLQHRELHEIVGGGKPALTYHLEKLIEAGIVVRVRKGEERGFSLKDPAAIRELLARYEPVDDVDARVHDTWDDLFSGHRRRNS